MVDRGKFNLGRLSPGFLLIRKQPGRFPPIFLLWLAMSSEKGPTVRDLLLTRRGVAFVSSKGKPLSEEHVRAVELELAGVGYVLSSRLRARLAVSSLDELVAFRAWALSTLLAQVGGDRKHKPLFRRFPDGVPSDTLELWWKKVLVHFLQAEGQPCLFCRRKSTTHVLDPCRHVVCDQCFDGSNYSACPVCEHRVDYASPFFRPDPAAGVPSENVVFRLIDLGENELDEARAFFVSLGERKQALSPADRDGLVSILEEYKVQVLSWLPQTIPVRQNVAIVFGTLFKACDPSDVLPHARRFMTTATDVLRFIAVLSGTDGSLLRETVFKTVGQLEARSGFWGRIAELFDAAPPQPRRKTTTIPLRVSRFKTAKLSRPLRRALLGVLEGLDPDRLVEDMLRHRSYWVWVGEFLHPHEYAARFPNVARALQIVRKKAPDGTPAPPFQSWSARFEQAIRQKDTDTMLSVLAERPGELARRLDYALRVSGTTTARGRVIATFTSKMPLMPTPVLVTLTSHLRARAEKARLRVYWPKGRVAKGVSSYDQRPALPRQTIEAVVQAIEAELLRRFSAKPAFVDCLIDEGLRTIIVPFNERTASRSAVSLPRGSRLQVPAGKLVRLFLHWCQPENGSTTDLDLSIGLYDESWRYVGVCSYYQLQARGSNGALIAQSAGDLRAGPWPDGASEFVDLDRDQALAAGVRYAVMVVNNYAGMPFSLLERGFAGLMLRDDLTGKHFDPRTVELKFALHGENGVFLPLVFDLRENVVHWLDVHAKGQFQFNNVENSNAAITKICPELMMYFASGVRTSMFHLALLHAAARCQRVFIRGQTFSRFVRRPDETVEAFYSRLVRGDADEPCSRPPRLDGPSVIAMLYRADVDLPDGSSAYALFGERVTPSLAASDLLS